MIKVNSRSGDVVIDLTATEAMELIAQLATATQRSFRDGAEEFLIPMQASVDNGQVRGAPAFVTFQVKAMG